jgi:hypothetical protein
MILLEQNLDRLLRHAERSARAFMKPLPFSPWRIGVFDRPAGFSRLRSLRPAGAPYGNFARAKSLSNAS